jgi:serine/threonine protein kinase
MAPERISGGMYSYPSDIWSFGLAVMAYAVGRLPVPTQDGYWGVVHAVQEKPSPRLQDFGSHFSPELCDFIDQCLQKNPLGRPSASQLLRHPFITTNYRSPRESSSAALFPGLGDATHSDADKKSDELETIAAKVESWCQAHAETLLAATSCQSPSSSAFHRVPVAQKAEALARQLRLPRDQVTARFNFLERFCPTK